jgi:hypothetical protein
MDLIPKSLKLHRSSFFFFLDPWCKEDIGLRDTKYAGKGPQWGIKHSVKEYEFSPLFYHFQGFLSGGETYLNPSSAKFLTV